MPESEKTTERYLSQRIEALGGKCWKWVSPNVRGVMDRICFLPNGIVFFVELKSEGKELAPHQQRRAKELITLGQHCYMADTKAKVDEIIKGEYHAKATSEGAHHVCNKR